VPTTPHPRLFLTAQDIAGLAARAKDSTTAAASLVADCQQTIDDPADFATRGGADGDTWPGAAVECAFAYLATQSSAFLAQAIKYWNAALNDDQQIGDALGCVAGANPNWQTWDQTTPAPPIILTVTHDTGYPIRWYGPYLALTYDWLYSAPGVDEALRSHTRLCLENWVDYYTAKGYHNTEAGSNYNAGYVLAKALSAIAISGDDSATSGHLWTETLDDVFQKLLVGTGLAGSTTGVGTPAGVMLGGDWGEGWQYGILSVAEYAAATRALEQNGASLPEMDSWVDSVAVRYIYGTVPHLDGQYVGGDFDSTSVYQAPSELTLDGVLLGPSSDAAASWAKHMQAAQMSAPPSGSLVLWTALSDLRTVTAHDYTTQTPAPPLSYLARGTRAFYARTSWDTDAFWAVFASSPQLNSDHQHFAASNFVFTRGSDHLIVDPSTYGCRSTLPTNAVTADSDVVMGTYKPSQTPWSQAELLWARASSASVFAARSDFAKAFDFSDTPSDISYAHRDWVLLPEGEVVAIDRVRTADAMHGMYVDLHANTGGTLKLTGSTASGTVGGSQVVIHTVSLSGGTPTVQEPPVNDNCYDGTCTNTRFATDEYSVKVPGPWAVAVHVVDGLGASEAPAVVAAMGDPSVDPSKLNTGVVGASVFRSSIQSYVVASSAQGGAAGASLTYSVPGTSAGRHVVFDAPEDANGESVVTATVQGARCAVTIAAGAGFAGHPLMFSLSAAAGGCTATEDTNVPPGSPPPVVDAGTSSLGSSDAAGSATSTDAGLDAEGGSIASQPPPLGAPHRGARGCAITQAPPDSSALVWLALTTGLARRRSRNVARRRAARAYTSP
jgi:hypothetical protein